MGGPEEPTGLKRTAVLHVTLAQLTSTLMEKLHEVKFLLKFPNFPLASPPSRKTISANACLQPVS